MNKEIIESDLININLRIDKEAMKSLDMDEYWEWINGAVHTDCNECDSGKCSHTDEEYARVVNEIVLEALRSYMKLPTEITISKLAMSSDEDERPRISFTLGRYSDKKAYSIVENEEFDYNVPIDLDVET